MHKRLFLLLLVMLLVWFSSAFAAVAIQKDGVEQGVATTINVVGSSMSTDGSTFNVGSVIEKFTTGDTLTLAESGKVVISTATATGSVFRLPSADTLNMQFTFIGSDASGITFSVQPEPTNQIVYKTCVIGDRITSPGTSGDSVSLISDASGNWYIKSMSGTFTDGN